MYQPYPSGRQLAGPLRAAVPAPVRTAARFMYAGAAVSIVSLIIVLLWRPASGAFFKPQGVVR